MPMPWTIITTGQPILDSGKSILYKNRYLGVMGGMQ